MMAMVGKHGRVQIDMVLDSHLRVLHLNPKASKSDNDTLNLDRAF